MEEECRTCSNKSRSKDHIFDGTQELDVPIADTISQWFGFPVESGDSHPEYICWNCSKCAQTASGSRHAHEEGQQMLSEVKQEDIKEEVYEITDIKNTVSYLVHEKAETPEDEMQDTKNYVLHGQVKDEAIVDELSEQEIDSESDQVTETDEGLLEKGRCHDDIDISQYRTTNKKHPFQCPDCSKFLSFQSDIKRHIRSHEKKRLKLSQSEEKPYLCLHCSKRFARKYHLKEHISTHAVERPYECPECEKTFKTNAYLRRHIRLHTKERPHKCSLCEMAFMSTSDLKRHNRTHSADRPCKCSDCPKTFQYKTDLKRHSWSHKGELPYSSPKCPKSLKMLNNHMEKTAGH